MFGCENNCTQTWKYRCLNHYATIKSVPMLRRWAIVCVKTTYLQRHTYHDHSARTNVSYDYHSLILSCEASSQFEMRAWRILPTNARGTRGSDLLGRHMNSSVVARVVSILQKHGTARACSAASLMDRRPQDGGEERNNRQREEARSMKRWSQKIKKKRGTTGEEWRKGGPNEQECCWNVYQAALLCAWNPARPIQRKTLSEGVWELRPIFCEGRHPMCSHILYTPAVHPSTQVGWRTPKP